MNFLIDLSLNSKHRKMITVFLSFLLLSAKSGGAIEDRNRAIYIPRKAAPAADEEGSREGWYCYRFTWLGERLDKNTFSDVSNKTCTEYFDESDSPLCVDPMVVTILGGKPDIDYIRKHHFKEATCKLSEDRVCAKYTIYYNGVASHVTRYCTRIDVESEGPLRSGCLTAKNGSYSYEVCACMSGIGVEGICNITARNQSSVFSIFTFLMLSIIVNDCRFIR